MSTYGELDPMAECKPRCALKDKREHITMVSKPIFAYLN